MTANPNYTIADIGGAFPTQADGHTAEGRPFYFRARHGTWTLSLGRVGGELEDIYLDNGLVIRWEGIDETGGDMTSEQVTQILDLHLSAVVIL